MNALSNSSIAASRSGLWGRAWSSPVVLLLFVFGAILGCSGEPEDGEGVEAARFTVQDSLLGSAVSDSSLGVTFRPPSVFQAAGAEFMAQVAAQMPRDPGNVYFVQPHMIFAIPGQTARIFVSGFPEKLDNQMDADWRDGYLKQAREKAVPQVPEVEEYTLGEVEVLQLTITSPEIVNIRLVCGRETRPLVQIDYLISQSLYGDLEASVESSMGALRWF